MIEFPTVIALEPIIKLWPSILIAIAFTIYRKTIDTLLASTASYYARQQINKSKPEWINGLLSQINNSKSTKSAFQNPKTINGLTQRQTATSKNCDSTNDLLQEFDSIACTKQYQELLTFFTSKGIELIKPQRRALKSYHKAFSFPTSTQPNISQRIVISRI